MRIIICTSLALLTATFGASAQTPSANRWTSDKYNFSLELPSGWSEDKALSAQAPLGNTLRSAPPGQKITSGAICAIDRTLMKEPLAKSQADLNQSFEAFTVEHWDKLLSRAASGEHTDIQPLPSTIINGVYVHHSTARFNKGKGVIRSTIFQTPLAAYWFYCLYSPQGGKAGATRDELLRSQIETMFGSVAIVEPPITFAAPSTELTKWTSKNFPLSLTLPVGWSEDTVRKVTPEGSSFRSMLPDDPSKVGAACSFDRIDLNLPPNAPEVTQEKINASSLDPEPVALWEAIFRKMGGKDMSDIRPARSTITNGVFTQHATAKMGKVDLRYAIYMTAAGLYNFMCSPVAATDPAQMQSYKQAFEELLASVTIAPPN